MTTKLIKLVTFLFLLFVFATESVAQTVTVPSLSAGSGATITVEGGTANSSLTLTVDNGDIWNPKELQIEIPLDASGKAEYTWEVPNWDLANFNAEGLQEITRIIASR